jgi:hypothetical protein
MSNSSYLGFLFCRGLFFVKDVHLFPQAELLKLNGGVFNEHHVARLHEGVDQLLPQAGQLVLVNDRET